jgi:pectate lyase
MKIKKYPANNLWLLRFILYGILTFFALLLIFYMRLNYPSKQLPLSAFPGAEGFGTFSPGGRYGHILFVSNLNDTMDVNSSDYMGSLRWAVEQSWPEDPADPYSQRRIIIFKVGGIIPLVDSLILRHPFVTIAGQTAPGDGITLKGNEIIVATHDVIIRGIRVRVGDEGQPTCCLDGINISTYYADSDVYNVVIDHSSVSWAIDENMSTWIDPKKIYTTHDITLQWNIISEGLYNSIHLDEGATKVDPHSMGAILGQNGTNMTVHHNIFAHNWGRNPRISGIINSEVINNVIYGWGNAAVEISKDKSITHVLNNYFKAGSGSRPQEVRIDPMPSDGQVYIAGNLTYDSRGSENLMQSRILMPENFKPARDFLFTPSNVTISSAEAAYKEVLEFAGVIYPVRDEVDQRIVGDVQAGTGKIIDSQNQVGGWPPNRIAIPYPEDQDGDGIPSEWEISHGLDPNNAEDASNPAMLSPAGYSWVEEYINSLMPPLK